MENQMKERVTLTVPETARVLGISRGLCYEMIREGSIPSLRLGRRIVVPMRALETLLASGTLDVGCQGNSRSDAQDVPGYS